MSTFVRGDTVRLIKVSENANKWLKAEQNRIGIIISIDLYGWEEAEARVRFNSGGQPRVWWVPFSCLEKAKLPEEQDTFTLVDAVLEWWKEHEHDSVPDFVKLAKQLRAKCSH